MGACQSFVWRRRRSSDSKANCPDRRPFGISGEPRDGRLGGATIGGSDCSRVSRLERIAIWRHRTHCRRSAAFQMFKQRRDRHTRPTKYRIAAKNFGIGHDVVTQLDVFGSFVRGSFYTSSYAMHLAVRIFKPLLRSEAGCQGHSIWAIEFYKEPYRGRGGRSAPAAAEAVSS